MRRQQTIKIFRANTSWVLSPGTSESNFKNTLTADHNLYMLDITVTFSYIVSTNRSNILI
jgi:hypothetical protein